MDFRKITVNDIGTIKPFLYNSGIDTCDYTVGGLFMWRDYFSMEYAVKDGALYSRLFAKDGSVYYNIPLGVPIETGIERLKKELKTDKLSFCTVPEKVLPEVSGAFKNIKITEQTDFSDYVYNAEDLRLFGGKKYGGQRNMLHQFKRENPVYSYDEINGENAPYITEFLREHYKVSENAGEFEREEENKVLEVLNNLGVYGFFGSMLKADGRIVGFSLGERVGENVFVHIEKADRNVKGAYQMLVNLFAERYAGGNVKFINREEDMGDAGLRTSKLSYHPVKLLRKYLVEI